jgi:hypothetical protein
MVNYFREPSEKDLVKNNTFCKTMEHAARDSGYRLPVTISKGREKIVLEQWTNPRHKEFNIKNTLRLMG